MSKLKENKYKIVNLSKIHNNNLTESNRNLKSSLTKTSLNSNHTNLETNFVSFSNYKDEIQKIEEKKKNNRILKFHLKKQKEKRRNSINQIHSEIMKESFHNNFYITTFQKNKTAEDDNCNTKTVQEDFENEKHIQFRKENSNRFLNSNSYNTKMLLSLTPLIQTQKETSDDLVKYVKNIRLSKFLSTIKKESVKRIKENRENQIEKINESITTNKHHQMLFLEAIEKINNFLKFLHNQKEKDKDRLLEFQNQKMKLESEIKKIESKTSKMKSVIEKLREYRNLLICVKEKVTSLPYYFYTDKFQTKYEMRIKKLSEEKKLKIASTLKSSTKNVLFSVNRILSHPQDSKKFATTKSDESTSNDFSSNNEKKFEKYKNINYMIFKSSSDFFKEFKLLENQNLVLINKRNEVIEKYEKVKSRYLTTKEDDPYDFYSSSNVLNEIAFKEKFLNDLKLRNHNLKEKLKNLSDDKLHDDNSNEYLSSYHSSKPHTATNFYKRIKNKNLFPNKNNNPKLFKISLHHDLNFVCQISSIYEYIKSHLGKFINPVDKFDRTSTSELKILFKLKEIEKTINFLCERYSYYKQTNKKELEQLEIELEKIRKINKARELVVSEQKRIRKIKNKIIQKNRIYFIQRKMAIRYEPFENMKKGNKQREESKEENEFEELISY